MRVASAAARPVGDDHSENGGAACAALGPASRKPEAAGHGGGDSDRHGPRERAPDGRMYARGDAAERAGGVLDSLGRRNPRTNALLIADVVVAIREAYAAGGVSQFELGLRYGVSQQCVFAIVRGRSWRDVGGPITNRGNGR